MERSSGWRWIAAFALAWLAACGGGSDGSGNGGGGAATIASVVLGPSSAVVAPGGTASFSAEARDAGGAPIAGVTFDWSSSDSAVATVAGGVATAVAPGTVTIHASSGGVSSNAVTLLVRSAGNASSVELIDTALATGELDAETALAYKVFAVYLDPRLPAKYLGDDSGSFETQALEDFRVAYDTLSPTTQALLEPYLRRPSDVGSWLDPAVRAGFSAAPREHAQQSRPMGRPTCKGTRDGWLPVDTANQKARVWYFKDTPDDGIAAVKVASYIDAVVWPVLINQLGYKEPLDDKRLVGCDGGDGRLDIYMVVMGDAGLTWPSNSANALGSNFQDAAYILINPLLSEDELKLATAHEVMHAIHWAYVSHAAGAVNGWFRDGLANWGADQVFNGNARLNLRASCHFNSAELSLTDDASGYCDGLPRGVSRNYGAHLPLQFLSKTRGVNIVKDILVATGGAVGSAVEAVDSVVPFKSWWPDYARKLWNRDTVTAKDAPATFDDWDTLTNVSRHTPKLAPDGRNNTDARLNGSTQASTAIATDVANLSVRYYRYTFGGEVNARSVMFHNTFYDNWKNGQAVSVRAFYKAEGQAWNEEDWTDVEWIGFCRDWKLQRLDELVVVVASAEWSGANPKVIAGQAPELMRNVIGCWEYKGEAKRTDTFGGSSGKSGSVVATFQASFDGHPGNTPLQFTDRSTGRLRVPMPGPLFTGGDWTLFEQYSSGSCSYAINSGGSSGSVSTPGGQSSGLMIFNNFSEALPAGLRPADVTGAPSLAYFGEGQTQNQVLGKVSGSGCSDDYTSSVGEWWLTRTDIANTKVVTKTDGSLDSTYSVPGLPPGEATVFTWKLVPVREP